MIEQDTLLLDTSIIFDLVGINQKKKYINYNEILKANKCYSTLTIYEMLDNKDFNKNEDTFKNNFKKVKEITQNVITNMEFDIKDESLLNLENCNIEELKEIKDKLFLKLKPVYLSVYNSIIIALVNFMFSAIVLVNKTGNTISLYMPTRKEKKNLDFKFHKFTEWLDNYVEEDKNYKALKTKDEIHLYFKTLSYKMLNYLVIVLKKMTKYSALGVKYSNRFINNLKKLLMDNTKIDKPFSMSEMLQTILDNVGNPPNLSLDLMKSRMIMRLCQMVRFKIVNDTFRKYFKTWIELRYNLTDENTRLENDIIDCFIGSTTRGEDGSKIFPISSDKKFIKNCCNSDEYKKYINFDLL